MTTTIKNYNLSKLTGLTDSNNTLSNVSINNSIIIPKSAENTNTNSDNANAGFYIKDVNSNGSGDFYNIKVNSEPSSIPALYFNNNEVLDRTNVLSTLESILEDYTLDTSNLMVTNGYINFANGSTPNTNQGNAGVGIRYSSANTVQFKNYDTDWIDLVDIINHDEFKELVDVDVTTNPLLDNQYITYNSGTAKFVNSNLSISHDANPTLAGDLNVGDYLLQFGDTYNRLVYNSEGIIDNNLIVLKNNSTLTNNYSYLEINNADIDGIVNPSIIVKSTFTDSNVGVELTTLNAGDINLNATTGNVNVNATHLVVSGDLVVQGTTTTIESVTTVYQDPILQIGGTTAPASDDNKDRGISFFYYDGGDKTGFMGYDNDTGNFIFKKNATITNDVVVSGTDAGISFGALTSSGDLDVTGTITGDTSLTLDTTTITTDEIGVLDGVTPGTATASKALVLDASKDIGTIRNLTIDGIFTDGNYTFDTSGNVSGLGTVGCGAITSSGTLDITDADNDTSLSLINNTITTADALVDISSISLTTGAMMRINANTAAHDGEILELINAGDATSTGTGLSITMPDITTGAATGINVTMVGATTTAKGISVTMDAITTGDMLYLDNGGATMTGDGKFINCNDDNTSQFSVGAKGLTTITGDASGTDALVITAGDILVSSGHIDMTVGDLTLADGSVSITDADNATSLSVTNNTITTNNLIDVTTSSLTTGSVINIDTTSTSFTGPIMNITTASTNANNITRWEPVYKNINNFIKGNLKFAWQTDTTATEVDTGLDLPFPTGVCIVKNIYIIITTGLGGGTISIGLNENISGGEPNGDANGFISNSSIATIDVKETFLNSEKGGFSESGGNDYITRWHLPTNVSIPQARSITITLSGTGSAGIVIMEYMGHDL